MRVQQRPFAPGTQIPCAGIFSIQKTPEVNLCAGLQPLTRPSDEVQPFHDMAIARESLYCVTETRTAGGWPSPPSWQLLGLCLAKQSVSAPMTREGPCAPFLLSHPELSDDDDLRWQQGLTLIARWSPDTGAFRPLLQALCTYRLFWLHFFAFFFFLLIYSSCIAAPGEYILVLTAKIVSIS